MDSSSTFTPKLFSILRHGYTLTDLKADLLAGLTVAIIALPLAMALAVASGATPNVGLVTAVMAGFVISLLGGSRVQIGGPTGAFVVVVFNVIAMHGYDGLLIATLLAGAILIIAGYSGMGQVIKLVPQPVVIGFTTGIALIIASTQVKDFFGLKIAAVPSDFIPKWQSYFEHFSALDLFTTLTGTASLAAIILLRKYAPKLPAYLLALIGASLAAAAFSLPVDTIGSCFPNEPLGIPLPCIPRFTFDKVQEVLPSAFSIAFLAGIEALLSAVVADGMTGYRHRPNQELVAQGAANIVSSLFGGLPATGALARTAANITSGAKSPMAGIFHSLFLLCFMLFAGGLMAYVPMPALAAILFCVAWGMSELDRFVHVLRHPGSDRILLLLTFLLTVFIDLTVAIAVGVTLASLIFMARMCSSVHISTTAERGEDDDQRADLPSGVEVFTIAGPVFFGVADEVIDVLKRIGPLPRVLIIRMRFVPFLDITGLEALHHVIEQCRRSGTVVIFAGCKPQPLKKLSPFAAEDVRFTRSFQAAIKEVQ